MIIKEALRYGNKKLNNANIESELLLASLLKTDRVFLLTHGEKKISKLQFAKYQKLLKQRLAFWPIAYLTGHKYFYGLDFFVNKNVLVPRPETEIMVDEILEIAAGTKLQPEIIDIGTGSGCIIISLAKNINKKISLIGIDISSQALAVAKKNAKNLKAEKIKFIKSYLLEKVLPSLKPNNKKHLIIAANLPYLSPSQIKESPSIKREPRLALVAGSKGLKYYQQLFAQITTIKYPRITVLCEIDPRQKNDMAKLIEQKLPNSLYKIKNDPAGLDRLVIIEINSK